MTMSKSEYEQYEKRVDDFFRSEGIENLTPGYHRCPLCQDEFKDDGKCSQCGFDRDQSPSFSHSACDCCGTTMSGDREPASGWNPETKEIQEYSICPDCVYYATYGQLDDLTMLNIEEEEEKNAG